MALLYILLGGFLLSSMHSPSCLATPANGDTLAAGQTLADGDKLVSRNGKFALGFFQFQPGPGTMSKSANTTTITSSSLGWYLGIWFNKIPVFTAVWVANREKPINDPDLKLTQLKISRDGNLTIAILHNSSTESIIWSTQIVSTSAEARTKTTAAAVLMNNGNLVLMAAGSSPNGTSLWQSFDYPTDVGLPGAKLGRNKVTGLNWRFISKKSLIDPGLGSYILELDTNGVLSHRHRKPPFVVYWSWSYGKLAYTLTQALNGLLDADPRTKGLFKPTYVNKDEEEYFTYTSSDESPSTFASIDITGQIKLNLWSQAKQSWETIYAQPASPCSILGVCGPYTVCNGKSRPFCGCMEGFSPKSPQHWEVGDPTGGCVRNTPLRCTLGNKNTTSATDMFYPIARVTLPDNPMSIEGAKTQNQCTDACLNDCSCTAYFYNNNRCSVWHGDLLVVNQNDGIDNFAESILYLRLSARDNLQSLKKNSKTKLSVVITASITSCGLLLFVLLLMIWGNKFKWCGVALHQGSSGGIIAFIYTDLGHATKKFTQRLGGGELNWIHTAHQPSQTYWILL
jgi:hypothetical protein